MRLKTLLYMISLFTTVITGNLTQVFSDLAIMSCIKIKNKSLQILSPLKAILLLFFLKHLIKGFINFFGLHKRLINIKRIISQASRFKKKFCYKILKEQTWHQYFSPNFFNYWVFYGRSVGRGFNIFHE